MSKNDIKIIISGKSNTGKTTLVSLLSDLLDSIDIENNIICNDYINKESLNNNMRLKRNQILKKLKSDLKVTIIEKFHYDNLITPNKSSK